MTPRHGGSAYPRPEDGRDDAGKKDDTPRSRRTAPPSPGASPPPGTARIGGTPTLYGSARMSQQDQPATDPLVDGVIRPVSSIPAPGAPEAGEGPAGQARPRSAPPGRPARQAPPPAVSGRSAANGRTRTAGPAPQVTGRSPAGPPAAPPGGQAARSAPPAAAPVVRPRSAPPASPPSAPPAAKAAPRSAPPAGSGAAQPRSAPPARPTGTVYGRPAGAAQAGSAAQAAAAAPAAPAAKAAAPAAAQPAAAPQAAAAAPAVARPTALSQGTGQAVAARAAVAASPAKAAAAPPARPPTRPALAVEPPPTGTALGSPDPPGSPPSRPQPRRRPATIGNVHVGQIVCWELAVAAIAATIGRPASVVIPAAITAAVILGVTTIRVDQRWVYQWIALFLRYAARRRRWQFDPEECRGSTLLAAVARGARADVLDLDGTEVALICHAGGMTAILEPLPSESGLIVESSRPLPAPTALLPNAEAGEPVVAAQVVVHTAPAPALRADTNATGTSYRYLGRGLVPAQRRCLIALQALRTADGHSDSELRAALASAVRRLQRRLRKDGMRVRVLDRGDALTALLALARLEAPPSGASNAPEAQPGPAGPDEINEQWNHWSTGREVQTAFRLREWPDLADPVGREFVDRMAGVSSLATTVAVSARRRGEEIEVEAVVRLTLPMVSSVDPASDQVAAAAELCGARVERLDGEQVFGVAASLPLGGFLP